MGDVPRICHWCWSCCHSWQLIPGMNNKIIIISHQREDGQFVKSIKKWAKDCPLMRWSMSRSPYIKLVCHQCTKGAWREGPLSGWRREGRLVLDAHLHIVIDQLLEREWEGMTSATPGLSIVRLGECLCHQWFISHEARSITHDFLLCQEEKWNQRAYNPFLGRWQLPYYKSPINWGKSRSNFIDMNVSWDRWNTVPRGDIQLRSQSLNFEVLFCFPPVITVTLKTAE